MSDNKNSKGGAHLSDAHLANVDEVKSPRPRQAGSMLMASARIEVDANCKPGDPLTPVLRKHAATYAERVRTEAPEYMQQVGAGGIVTVVDQVFDAASGTIGVRLELPNPGYAIPAGLKCQVRFGGIG